MLIQESLTLQQKLEILSDAAKYDVACTSSGVDRGGRAGMTGNTAACGICHSFSADGRCISLLKILMTNACIYDCKYCINRVSNDTVRTFFTPDEICALTMQFYRRNYIEGLFLSSGILNTPNETMEHFYQTLWKLREEYHFRGYIHVKAIPGADPAYIELIGRLADRMSVNLELPTADGLKLLAPSKTRKKLLTPMRQIQNGIARNSLQLAKPHKLQTNGISSIVQDSDCSFYHAEQLPGTVQDSARSFCRAAQPSRTLQNNDRSFCQADQPSGIVQNSDRSFCRTEPAPLLPPGSYARSSKFVPAGQSTQMIIGATPETDFQILSVSEALYDRFALKRVFYSAYTALNDDSSLPARGTPPPLLREHRLYQADWLLRFYGFGAGELLSDERPNFNPLLDPKCDWALRHLDRFPIEVATADYATLLRIPGVGVKSARRILAARRHGTIDFSSLKKFGVVLKRAGYFITCCGKMYVPLRIDEDYLTRQLVSIDRKKCAQLTDAAHSYRQLSLFDDFHLAGSPTQEDL